MPMQCLVLMRDTWAHVRTCSLDIRYTRAQAHSRVLCIRRSIATGSERELRMGRLVDIYSMLVIRIEMDHIDT